MASRTLALAAAAAVAGAALQDLLAQSVFFESGTVYATDQFAYTNLYCGYLEGENISSVNSSWGVGCAYMIYANESGSGGPCDPTPPTPGYDRPGGDYRTQVLTQDNATACEALCCGESQCDTWVYVPSAPSAFEQCNPGDHCCYLKNSNPAPSKSSLPGITSGSLRSPGPTPGNFTAPPVGMRSAVPLGGIGAGAFEVRADGSVHEFTIINMSPAGSAKFGVVGDALVGVKVTPTGADPSSGVARAMRTSPPAGVTGVESLTYSGTYPLSRWALGDAALPVPVTVYAYSTLKPGDMAASGAPAVAFTAVFDNSGGSAPLDVSLMLNMPLAAINNCAHHNGVVGSTLNTSDAAACLAACAAAPGAGCASWQWSASSGACSLFTNVGAYVYSAKTTCGVRGTWASTGTALSLGLHPEAGAGGPMNGDITLAPALDDADASQTFGFATGASVADVWAAFAGPGFGAAVPSGTAAGTGAVSVTATVPAGANASVSLVFAWYFPDRDHYGVNVGNYYSTLWDGSVGVASQLATVSALSTVVADLNSHHAVFATSSMPVWLQDASINMMSHFRGLMWFRDGRAREYEAYDCPDVDSVHNDYQRHLAYLWVMPFFETSKMREWASGQAGDGHIQEYLGSFGVGPIDVPGGRTMGDVTTVWILELLELYKQTGDLDLLTELYPNVVRGIGFQIEVSQQIGLPWHLVCTYDILDLQQYNTTTFNSMLHLAALKAGVYFANIFNDTATAAAATAAITRAEGAVQALLWNSTYNYYRAYTGGDAIMADALYGQMLAHHHGLGWLVDPATLADELAAEAKYNLNPYGFTVVTGRNTPPPVTTDSSKSTSRRAMAIAANGAAAAASRFAPGADIDTTDDTEWLGGGPTYSYIGLTLGPAVSGLTVDQALEPTRRTVENFRTRLHDMWNFVGLTSGADWPLPGYPWITSHYGFALPTWYLPYALSGQDTDIAHGSLSFAPLFPVPYSVPVLLPGTTGTLTASAGPNTKYTLSLAFGQLSLPAGGLVVSGKPCPAAFAIGAGESISWQA